MKKKFTTIRSRITLTTITLCIFLSIAVSYISYSFYYKSVKQNMIRTAESSLTLLGPPLTATSRMLILSSATVRRTLLS